METLAQWAQSIAQLKTQVNQLSQQISIQSDLRSWIGNPSVAGANVNLATLGVASITQVYGQVQATLVNVPDSLASLGNTSSGIYRALQDTDLNGNPIQHDAFTLSAIFRSGRRAAELSAGGQQHQCTPAAIAAGPLASTLVAHEECHYGGGSAKAVRQGRRSEWWWC